ncbi:CBN-CLEC-50 protein [Aphelenchoides avenae]|nr:CBN-CLEC-50 protein [Aphelenchus avenae]
MNWSFRLALVAIAASYAAARTCPWYTTKYPGAEDACYVVVDSVYNWTSAEEACRRWPVAGDGGHLASVHDSTVNAYLQKLDHFPSYPLYWLGGRKVNGVWTWTDGSQWNYSNWARGQPAGKGECLAMTVKDGRWYSDDCTQPTPFTCKIPDLMTNYTAPPLVPTLDPSHPTSDKCPKDWQYIASTNLCYRA